MKHPECQYLDILREILYHGSERTDRTGIGTKSLFGSQMRFDLQDGFPLLTTKKVWFKGVALELLWILAGETNVRYLQDHGVKIWDAWADEHGDLGPIYGAQWRNWNGKYIDQIADTIAGLQNDPYSRRHVVSAWNPEQLPQMKLSPCHCLFQFHVQEGKLNCQLYQRSCDWAIGVPFNIASYALLTMMIAQVVGLEPGIFIHTGGDIHVYKNLYGPVEEQLKRSPLPFPKVRLNQIIKNIDDFRYEDIELIGYQHHPAIEMPIAV